MDKSQVIGLLKNIPINTDINYTVALKEFVLDNDMYNFRDVLVEIMNSNETLEVKFSAFYSLVIIYREYGDYSQLIKLVDDYGTPFESIKLYDIVLSIYYRNKLILGDKSVYHNAIKYAQNACTSLPTNLAIKHHYAETIAFIVEENLEVSNEELNMAIEHLEEVIRVYRSHAKYYCTKGRLLAALGDYDTAIHNINRALDLETANNKDAMIRIGQYNYHLLRIQMLKSNGTLDLKIHDFNEITKQSNLKITDLMNNVESMKTQYLEYLAFFSSVLAFIMITINVAINIDDYGKAIGLVIIIAGVLTIAFTLFRIMLPFTINDKYYILKIVICIISSIVLICIGLLFGYGILDYYIKNKIMGLKTL